MSLLPQQTTANANLFYFLKGNGKELTISTLNAQNANVTNLSTAVIGVSSLTGNFLSTIEVDAEYINNSTINTLHVDLDGQILTANATELLLNGIPLATLSNLSSIADWSLDPAISTVQMAGNDLDAAGNISTTNIRGGNAFFQNLIAYNSLFVSSQTSTISSVVSYIDDGFYSTLNAGSISTAAIATSSIGGAGGTLSTLNIGAGGNILVENFGVSFASVGSAQLGFQWFYQDGNQTDMFYDTNISSVRMMTKNPGGYTDAPASRLHVPQAGISSLEVSSLSVSDQLSVSSIYANLISTPQLYVSSINGSEFNSTGIIVQVAGVSSLVANSISSIGAELRTALVSTLQFNPSFSPTFSPNVNLGLGSILGNVIGWGAGVFGAAAGIVGLGTGVASLMMGRQNNFIDNSKYELINGTTQLQFSTLGSVVSSIYRVSDSPSPDQIPGSTLYISTILPAGTLALRSVSDPLNTVSTPNSTIQAFGPWVAVPPELATSSFTQLYTSSLLASSIATLDANVSSVVGLSSINGVSITNYENVSSIDWAYYPAVSTINFSTGVTAVVAASAGSDIALTGASVKLIGGYTDAYNLLLASTISTAVIQGSSDNVLFPTGGPGFAPGLKLDAPNIFLSTSQTLLTGFTNASTVGANRAYARLGEFSSLTVSSITQTGLSSITYQTAPAAGTAGQPAGRLLISGNDVDLIQQDLWCQQIRLGAGNPGGSAQTEIIFYDPTNATQRGFNLANLDRTIRVVSTVNAGTGGYILDTAINAPFFSTINAGTSTALFAFFPSTTTNTIGASTLSVIPNPIFVAAAASLSSQNVLAANTPLALDLGSATVNVGGFTLAASTLTVPVAGTYQFSPSIQFNTTSGGANQVDFWVTKNGADLPNSASRVSVANNAEQIGTVILYDTAAANDQYGIKIASADANMSAGFFQSTVATPYTRPAIPSIILNAQRIA